MSKYLPLANFLSEQNVDYIALRFSEIENILNNHLPKSAYEHSAWWANSRTSDSHIWAHLWIEAGWEVTSLNLLETKVEFTKFESFSIESTEAVEGYGEDRVILSKKRNVALSQQRKELDQNTCQVCGFHKQVNGKWVIEVHHLSPLSITGETVTSIEDLISLCPTCHRVAHTKKPPYKVKEIKQLLCI
ncbi:HNH endonuclease [Pseudoalteromonas sp. Angola-30]|uniref:HNH endonuclease n=1 Tax=Pseudoalteromonas sp. Angola-30 TaxID=3025341 RepID=UPI0023591A2A|nr:HNH endonuclease [Pseudoalteromonas sp. Angola-30]MDC9524253.1 HNH endonuclease [Pseudoalteromonas sp. Angola-30]